MLQCSVKARRYSIQLRDVRFDITVFPNQNVLVSTVSIPSDLVVDDLVTTSSIVGDVDEFADANTSDISIDLDVDATNQHDVLDEKHGTDGEDNCILEVLDLLEDCCEGEDEMPELHESSSDGKEPREGRAVMVEFTKLKLMLMKSEPDVHFIRRCKVGMVLVDSVDDTLGACVSKNSLLKPEFPTAFNTTEVRVERCRES
jgi:hypothetical protein